MLLKSKVDCLNAGDFLNDTCLPTGVSKTCVCNDVSWPSPPAQKPTCAEAHGVCLQSSLSAGMPMGACTNSADSNVEVPACESDAFCCTNSWDAVCVGEMRSMFCASVDKARSQSNPNLTCYKINTRAAQIEQQADALGAAVPCVGPRGASTGPQCESRSGRGNFSQRAVRGLPAPENM